MSNTTVSKVLVGKGIVFPAGGLDALNEGQLVVFDYEDGGKTVSDSTKRFGFAVGTAVAEEPILSGEFKVGELESVVETAFSAPKQKKDTVKIVAPTAAAFKEGSVAKVKVVYHDNLSIVPNQLKQTVVAVPLIKTETATNLATRIAEEFNMQESLLVTVTASGANLVVEGKEFASAANYNGIDRPEFLVFESSAVIDGVEAEVTTNEYRIGHGTPAQVAYMEDQAQGRRGFADRRSWNDTKKFKGSVDSGVVYSTYVITALEKIRGEMNSPRLAPIGAVLAIDNSSGPLFKKELEVVFTPILERLEALEDAAGI